MTADPIRSALFIDFDNIYGGLTADYDASVARSFATNPRKWIDWLSSFQGVNRRILLRKCYLNPVPFARYRLDFTHAACEVIDCPSLTRRGKSSADIYMALDIVDALDQKEPSFQEFIIMSADADFTAVLFRLRRNDRRTLVIAPAMASAAYTGIAEVVVDTDEFVSKAIAADDTSEQGPGERNTLSETADPKRAATPVDPAIRNDALRVIEQHLREKDGLEQAPTVAHSLQARFPHHFWFGYSTFKEFLESHLPDIGLRQEIDGPRHVIFDPAVHASPTLDAVAARQHLIDQERQPELHELTQRLRRLANVPALRPTVYAALFRILGSVAREGGEANVNGITRVVRDRIVEEGFQVPRSAVNWVVRGLQFQGCDFSDRDGEWDSAMLAQKYRSNVVSVAEAVALDLDDDQRQLLNDWLQTE